MITLSPWLPQPDTHSAGQIHSQNNQFPVTTPQQLLEQGEALYQAGQFTKAVNVLQKANYIYQQQSDLLGQAAALTNLCLGYGND